jgi:hypothetical protein
LAGLSATKRIFSPFFVLKETFVGFFTVLCASNSRDGVRFAGRVEDKHVIFSHESPRGGSYEVAITIMMWIALEGDGFSTMMASEKQMDAVPE